MSKATVQFTELLRQTFAALQKTENAFCERCDAVTPAIIKETADGWEVWTCSRCRITQKAYKTK